MTTKRHGWKLVKKSKFWGFLWRHHPNSDVINLKLGILSSFIKVYNWWKFQGQSISGSWDLRGGGGFGGGQNARGIIRAKTCEGLSLHRSKKKITVCNFPLKNYSHDKSGNSWLALKIQDYGKIGKYPSIKMIKLKLWVSNLNIHKHISLEKFIM